MSDFDYDDGEGAYYPSGSEDELTNEERILLEKARSGGKNVLDDNEEALFDLPMSDSDDEGDEKDDVNVNTEDFDIESDLDKDEDDLPDEKAWGKKKRSFYNTDYVDQDYGGIFQGEDAENAEQEEEEARKIQKRLVEQMLDSDFGLNDLVSKVVESSKEEIVETDLSKLTKRQKLDLVQKESPEFLTLVNDFTEKLTEVKDRLLPIMKLVENGKLKQSPGVDYVFTKFHLILNYCTNICFYVMLKAKRVPVKDHPVIKCLLRYRQLLLQLDNVNDVIEPEITKLTEKLNEGDDLSGVLLQPAKKTKSSKKGKKKLCVLKQLEDSNEKDENVDESWLEHDDIVGDDDSFNDDKEMNETEDPESYEKRAITYEMAKNKGLTPRRKKEQRNPRVKHRNKFRKAVIRRRGQVRTARKEIPNYGGEPSGIKVDISKSIKFKY